MLPIAILASNRSTQEALLLTKLLAEEGFDSTLVRLAPECERANREFLENAPAIVALVDTKEATPLLYAGYLIGLKKNLFIVTERPDTLPELLKKQPCFGLKEKSLRETLGRQIRHTLSVEEPPPNLGGLNLLDWISANPERISSLTPKQFEELINFLLSGLHLQKQAPEKGFAKSYLAKFPASSNPFYIECVYSAANEKVDLDVVQHTAEATLSLGCDFGILLTKNPLTRAAWNHAKHCFPPVRIIDQTSLAEAIKARLLRGINESYLLSFHGVKNPQELHTSTRRAWIDDHYSYGYSAGHEHKPKNMDVFVTSLEGEPNDLNVLIKSFSDSGAKVWHSSDLVSAGEHCHRLNDIATAVSKSDAVIILLGNQTQWSLRDTKIIKTVALEVFKKDGKKPVFVVGTGMLDRLRLPNIFDGAPFFSFKERNWALEIKKSCLDLDEAQHPPEKMRHSLKTDPEN